MSRGIEKWFVPDANPRGIKSSVTGHYIPVTIENIRLMAAAPELLEALQIAVRQNSHDMQMTGEELRACTAAIAKETGSVSAQQRVTPSSHPPCPVCFDTDCNGECMENL